MAVGLPARDLLGMDWALATESEAEYVMTAADGERIDLNIRYSPLRDNAANLIGWVLVAHDVTERNRQRHELRLTNEELRQLCEATPLLIGDAAVTSTISAGVAEFLDSDSPAALIDAADQALYVAKTLGRNRVEVARISTAAT